MTCFTEENVAKKMDNIRDRWNEVNGKSLHVDKQTFNWKNNSILHAQMEFQRVNVMSIP